jgi:ATP-grasp domain, R2K clade family 2
MKQLNLELPRPNDYPESLKPFRRRRIWKTTLGQVEQGIVDDMRSPVFIKPAERRKSFTGRTFASIEDFARIGSVSRKQEVWCSEVVEWRAEYRVYVIGLEIASIDHYHGDSGAGLDLEVVHSALEAFRASGEAPSAYGIDFGVLGSGETALLEVNDGYALGAYKIGAERYADLVLTRWAELVSALGTRSR